MREIKERAKIAWILLPDVYISQNFLPHEIRLDDRIKTNKKRNYLIKIRKKHFSSTLSKI